MQTGFLAEKAGFAMLSHNETAKSGKSLSSSIIAKSWLS
jgi:hypothetical protein